jgi:hypothetical protein
MPLKSMPLKTLFPGPNELLCCMKNFLAGHRQVVNGSMKTRVS